MAKSPSEATMHAIEEVFSATGVHAGTLTPAQKSALDQRGYVVLEGVIDPLWLKQLRAAFETAAAEAKNAGGKEGGTRHIAGLIQHGEVFERLLACPTVLAAAYQVLQGAFKVMDLHGRDPLPGFGQQGLHADWTAIGPDEPYPVATTIWMLDDFTRDNGSTRIVPGTQLFRKQVPKGLASPGARHNDEIRITAAAGSVLVFNGHLWHSGTRNHTEKSRRAIQCVFLRREFQTFAAPLTLPQNPGPIARYLLDRS